MTSDEEENRAFWGLLVASCAHVFEEYVYPGGFLETAREVAPETFEHATRQIVVGINTAMIAGCLNGALIRKRNPFYGLSMASLLFFNALIHAGDARSPRFKRSVAITAALFGIGLHSIPFLAFAIRAALTKTGKEEG